MSSNPNIFERLAQENQSQGNTPESENIFDRLSKEGHFKRTIAHQKQQRKEMYEKYKGHPKQKLLGLLEGLGNVAQSVSGGLETPQQKLQKQIREQTEPSELRTRRELGSDIGEFVGSLAVPLPFFGAASKGLKPKKGMEESFNFLKKHGFTEKEMTPLLQSQGKLDFFKTLSSKDDKTKNLMKSIYEKFSNVYEPLMQKGSKSASLTNESSMALEEKVGDVLKKIPRKYRSEVSKDIQEFFNSPQKFSDYIQFDQNLNASLGGERGGKNAMGIVKGPMQEAMAKEYPSLMKEYLKTKEMYKKFAEVSSDLAPSVVQELIDAGKLYGIAASLSTGNVGLLTKLIGLTAARKLAREALINPSLQNIVSKIGSNLNKGNKPQVAKLMEALTKVVRKKDPELSDQLDREIQQPETDQ